MWVDLNVFSTLSLIYLCFFLWEFSVAYFIKLNLNNTPPEITKEAIERLAEDRRLWNQLVKDIMMVYHWTCIDNDDDDDGSGGGGGGGGGVGGDDDDDDDNDDDDDDNDDDDDDNDDDDNDDDDDDGGCGGGGDDDDDNGDDDFIWTLPCLYSLCSYSRTTMIGKIGNELVRYLLTLLRNTSNKYIIHRIYFGMYMNFFSL